MSALVVNDAVDFNTLKEILGTTDGNLASHIKALEKMNYITIHKQFIGRKPNTKYSASTRTRTSTHRTPTPTREEKKGESIYLCNPNKHVGTVSTHEDE